MNDQHNHLGCFPKPTTSFTPTETKLLALSVCTVISVWNYSWLYHFSVQLKDYLECSRRRTHQEWFLWIDLQKGLQVHLVALKRPGALLHIACAALWCTVEINVLWLWGQLILNCTCMFVDAVFTGSKWLWILCYVTKWCVML